MNKKEKTTTRTTLNTLTSNTLWILDGPTYVTNGATLTIQPGTFIKGLDRAESTSGNPSFLLVARNSKLIADGTCALPIVFTSNKLAGQRAPGDWAGVVLLGNGVTNVLNTPIIEGIDASYVPSPLVYPDIIQYGGGVNGDEADLAGASIIRNVRIEFAGDELTTDNELNGLTLGAVGSSTILENIQVSWGADDAFEFFGGSVNAKNLIAYGNNDDDFDFDQGYQGSIQFAVSLKLPCIDPPYSSNPNGIESNNITSPIVLDPAGRKTHPVLSNLTILGTNGAPGPTGGRGAYFRVNSEFTFVNSLIGGFSIGIDATTGTFPPASVFANNAIHAFTTPVVSPLAGTNIATSTAPNTSTYLRLVNPFNFACSCPSTAIPDFRFFTTPPVSPANNRADFTGLTVTHPGGALSSFTSVTYAGAFGANGSARWDECFASYSPQCNPYTACN